MEIKMIGSKTKPFKLSRPQGLVSTTAHWWATRYCFFTGKGNHTYRVTASLIGNGYYDLPRDGRGLIVEVQDDRSESLTLECMKQIEQPLTYEASDALLVQIERELDIRPDSAEVKGLEKRYNLS